MKNYIGGLFLAGMFLSAYTSYFGYTNRQHNLDEMGAGSFTRSFSGYCHKYMDRNHMRFRYGSPTPQYGCICVGVKMEQKHPEQVQAGQTGARAAFAAYMEFLKNTELKRPVHDIAWNTHIPREMQRAIKSSFHYCDDYTLKGSKRVDLSRYPKHLKKIDNRYSLVARRIASEQ